MKPYNWKQFTKRITIDAGPQTIFKSRTMQRGFESLFLKLAEFKKPEQSWPSK